MKPRYLSRAMRGVLADWEYCGTARVYAIEEASTMVRCWLREGHHAIRRAGADPDSAAIAALEQWQRAEAGEVEFDREVRR
jgi:hypothetical protein